MKRTLKKTLKMLKSLPLTPLAKVPTGITGFDEISYGGLPLGRTTLVWGGPGCGKTVFAVQSLVNAARAQVHLAHAQGGAAEAPPALQVLGPSEGLPHQGARRLELPLQDDLPVRGDGHGHRANGLGHHGFCFPV